MSLSCIIKAGIVLLEVWAFDHFLLTCASGRQKINLSSFAHFGIKLHYFPLTKHFKKFSTIYSIPNMEQKPQRNTFSYLQPFEVDL
jgi:hypothetical protein